MQSCSVLDDKQLSREISDFLTSEKSRQKTSSNVSISLSEFEKKLGQKFKCSVEIDRERIIGMLTTMLAARNRYLESASRGQPVQLFTLDANESQQPSKHEETTHAENLDNLSPCFSGRVQVQGIDLKTSHWPLGILIIPNFLSEPQYLAFQTNIYNAQYLSSKLECLSQLFSQYKFTPSIPNKPSVHANIARSSGIKISIEKTTLLLSIGEVVLFVINYKGSDINIPLVSGSLLCLDSSLRDWNMKILPPKTGMNHVIQFRS